MKYIRQLKTILEAASWSQEELAKNLGVSFPTVNSWINSRSKPRKNSILKIDKLYMDIVGVDSVSEDDLSTAKQEALNSVVDINNLIKDSEALDKLTLYLTYHTNTIEGSTMTISDVQNVIFEDKVLSNRTSIEQAEARNHQATLNWLLSKIVDEEDDFVVDEELIIGIHLRLMNGIISDAGEYRKHSVRIMGSSVPLANPVKIPDLITSLSEYIKNSPDDVVAHLTKTHADFEKIHPFSDGNGRVGRLLMLAQALKAGILPPIISKERKYAYYKYLELAQTKSQYGSLELFVCESIRFSKNLLEV